MDATVEIEQASEAGHPVPASTGACPPMHSNTLPAPPSRHSEGEGPYEKTSIAARTG